MHQNNEEKFREKKYLRRWAKSEEKLKKKMKAPILRSACSLTEHKLNANDCQFITRLCAFTLRYAHRVWSHTYAQNRYKCNLHSNMKCIRLHFGSSILWPIVAKTQYHFNVNKKIHAKYFAQQLMRFDAKPKFFPYIHNIVFLLNWFHLNMKKWRSINVREFEIIVEY